MNKRFLVGALLLLLVLSGVVTTTAQSTCTVTALEDVTAYRHADFGEVFARLDAGTTVEVETWTLSGWYGFDPGIAQAPNQGLERLRWLPVELVSGMRLDGDCASVPPVDGGVVPPDTAIVPAIDQFVIKPTGTLHQFGAVWLVEGVDAVVLEVHLPGDPSGEPMLVLDELPLVGNLVVNVPFHTPDTGVRFVLWGVNRVPNPPSPQERYSYLVSETVNVAPFATPTASPVQPSLTPSPTASPVQPPFTSSPTYTPPPVGDLFNVPSTYQWYDSGLMIWRSDIGFVWALANDGRVFGLESANYSGLPLPNPQQTPPPPGKFLPIMGFGRVWANFPAVRGALGWPATSESSFLLGLGFDFEHDRQRLRLPNQRWIELLSDNTWRYLDGTLPTPVPVTPPPVVTPVNVLTGATYQPFTGGFMIWRADFGDIHVFEGQTSGTTSVYSLAQYSQLPDPAIGQPPAGFIKPIFGFGKVWGHTPPLQQSMGWAIRPEVGYTLNIQYRPANTVGIYDAIFSLPDGSRISIDGGTWRMNS